MRPEIERKREEIAKICQRYNVRRLAVFGSALRQDFDPERSDVDLLVEFGFIPEGQYPDIFFGLLDALQRVLGRKVDLIVDRSIRNPYLRLAVEAAQEQLYAAA